MALDNIASTAWGQSQNALTYGDIAAKLADPFKDERGFYQNELRKLISNPGSFTSSPAYKFAYDQGLNALNRQGGVRSGAKLAALMKYGQDRAGQLYGQQAGILTPLAMGGSSPGAAGAVYAAATNRAQDYQSINAAARNAGQMGAPTSGYNANSAPSVPPMWNYGGGQSGSTGGYSPSSLYTEMAYKSGGDPYTPSVGAGTGYMTSDYGRTDFGAGMPSGGYYDPYYEPYSDYGMPDLWNDYTNGGGWADYSDYGGYDYGGYDYGGGDYYGEDW